MDRIQSENQIVFAIDLARIGEFNTEISTRELVNQSFQSIGIELN